MIFVCPHYDGMGKGMLDFCRLYAFPVEPEGPAGDGFVILDSGAFGLSQRGEKMGVGWMRMLGEYYREYTDREGFYCIAPDIFLDPVATRRNWEWWQADLGMPVPIVPVIQFPKRGKIDVYSAVQQARFYASWEPEMVAISNPSLTAAESGGIAEVCAMVREITGARYLHNLGAGWSPKDVADWRELGCFDSIDSVAYYTDVQESWRWRKDGKRERVWWDVGWRELAVENAKVAVEIARGDG